MKKKIKVLINLGITAILFVGFIVEPTNLNPMYPEGAFSLCFVISLYLIVNTLLNVGGVKIYTDEFNRAKFDFEKSGAGFKRGIVSLAVIWVLYFGATIVSAPLFNYKAYRDQLGKPVTSEFTSDIQPVDINQIPIVDQTLAYTLADKKVGENPGMGSQVVLGEPVIQQVNGELIWVVPLHHSGFFKWLSNIEGSAGYITVSATNTKDVEFVGEYKIKYQPNSYFFDDIERHVRISNGRIFNGLTDYSFELDDNGVPHWIITEYKNSWIFSLPEATGVMILNATNGELKSYNIDVVPDWVDRVQPEEFIMHQISNQGQYVHGIFNFSNQDKFKTSKGRIIVYNDGNCYLFTGLTSIGTDESAIGFIMVDMVTKTPKLYSLSGATEYAAQISAQGKVQQYGYVASFPIIINLDGAATYFMTLKDKAGLIKQYGFVSVSDFSSVGTGETIAEAMRNYRQVLRSSGGNFSSLGEDKDITGVVARIAAEVINNTTIYRIILEQHPDMIFTILYDISEELALTHPGDSVNISYVDAGEGIYTVRGFDNNQIGVFVNNR